MAKPSSEEFHDEFIRHCKGRMLDASVSRILRCLELLSEEEIWYRPNENTVSIGNLILHLCGNVRQWIVSGIGGAPDVRVRHVEFDELGSIPTSQLVEQLTQTMMEAEKILDAVSPESLLKRYRVQDEEATGIGIVVRVVEHFSYHTGQIALAVKSRKNVDLGYFVEAPGETSA